MIRDRVTTIVRTARQRPAPVTALALLLVLVAGYGGYLIATRGVPQEQAESSDRRILYWYDPMVPQEHYPGPGKSSMGMALQPKYAGQGAQGGIQVSPAMVQNLGIRVVPAQMQDLAPTISAVGRVQFDDRLIAEVQTLTPGFIESLAVRAEGEPVVRGRRLATVYSPDLYGAEQEYAALLRIRGSTITPGLRAAAANRLQLLGLPGGAIASLSRGGAPQRTYAVFAPTSGIVSKIGARPGAQVTPGQSIVTIAGLSAVLVVAEVPEASLGGIHVGLPVKISFPAYPGDIREGRIDYIYPSLDPQTRTARVRITLANPGGRLRDGMFASIQILGAGGMALVVPSEAVIDTGKRKIVIVRRKGMFFPAEVTTGSDSGASTQVLTGLSPGDQVVASGQFLIDSEASISGVMAGLYQQQTKP
jgi:Cu(I)/Ag(I) efflux system membrane fusion protein